jgi:hypothetical protein
VVRIPSLSGRPGTAPARDENPDGRIDEHDKSSAGTIADERPTSPRTPEPSRRVGADHSPDVDRGHDTDRKPEPVVPAGPHPRASMLATLSLIFGVAAGLFVLTGALAGYGIGLGGVALLLAIGGISATGRRHVAGKTDALIGLVLGLGAVVLGILALTGSLSWLTTDTDTVARVREWLDSQFIDRF